MFQLSLSWTNVALEGSGKHKNQVKPSIQPGLVSNLFNGFYCYIYTHDLFTSIQFIVDT